MFRSLICRLVLAGIIVGLLQARPAAAQNDTPVPPTPDLRGGEATISQPQANQLVIGSVQIVGTALAPDFDHYELAWSPDPPLNEDAWLPVQPPIKQQVRAGVLGAWDSTQTPDGLYLLRLRTVRSDQTFIETQVRIQVANATPTPTLTPIPTVTSTLLPGPATVGPSPTPLIQQPPTRTPRPTQTPGGPTATPDTVTGADSPFRPERLRGAACIGIWFTLLLFGGLGLYGVFRMAVRGQIRDGWWSFRRDVRQLMDRTKRVK
jgi:hypothetical protein